MTGPITFDPTPHPTLPDICDGVDAFADTANTSGVNFGRVNGYVGGRGNASAFLYAPQTTPVMSIAGTGDIALTPTYWAPFVVTVPPGCLGMLLVMRAAINATDSMATLVALFASITGSGLRVPADGRHLELMCTGAFFIGARSMLLLGTDLVPGGQVTINVTLGRNAAGSVSNVQGGALQGTLFRGP